MLVDVSRWLMLTVQDPRVYSLLIVDRGQEGRMPAPPLPRAPSKETPPSLWAESVMADPSAIQQ